MAEVKWIKIATDIFDDEKILLIESMPDSYAMITVWFKLLCLAGKQNNGGVFVIADKIAYTDEMFATIFRMPLNTVRLALDTFERFGMIERLSGIVTIPKWDKHQSLDSYERKKEYNRQRNAAIRQGVVEKLSESCQKVVAEDDNKLSEVVAQKRIDKNRKEKNREEKNRVYKNTYYDDATLNESFIGFVEMRKRIKAPMTDKAVDLAKKKLESIAKDPETKMFDEVLAVKVIEQSVLNCWKTFYPLKEEQKKANSKLDWIDKIDYGDLNELPFGDI